MCIEHLFVLGVFPGEYFKRIRKFGQFSVILAMLPIGKSVREFKFTQCQCDNIEGQFYQSKEMRIGVRSPESTQAPPLSTEVMSLPAGLPVFA